MTSGVRLRRLLPASVVALSLALTACGSSDGGGGTTSKDSRAGSLDPVAGCESYGVSIAPGGEAPRCEPGAPAPHPLGKRTKIIMNTPPGFEFSAPFLWAAANGEYEKENLEVEIQNLPTADAYTLAAQGKIDFACSGPNAPMYNAISQDFDLKWVTGSASTTSASKSGLWARKGTTLKDLEGGTIASAAGSGSASLYPVDRLLDEAGVDLSKIKVEMVQGPDMQQALSAGAIDAGIFLDPRWVPLEKSGDFEFLGTTTPQGESLLGCVAGPRFYEHRDAAVAFIRATSRTINTTFAGDYHQDTALVDEVAVLLGITPEALTSTPSLEFDLLVRSDTSEGLQKTYAKTKALQYPDVLPDEEVIDRTLLEEAHGVRFGG